MNKQTLGKIFQIVKKPAAGKLLITVIWLTFLSLLRFRFDFSVLFLWLGGIFGTFLLEADHLIYLIYLSPQEPTSIKVRELFNQRRWPEALETIIATKNERQHLIFHSALLQVLFQIFSIFVVTSTASYFGIGMVLAMSLSLLVREINDLLQKREEALKQWLFWQIKTEVKDQSLRVYVVSMALFFLFLNFLLLR